MFLYRGLDHLGQAGARPLQSDGNVGHDLPGLGPDAPRHHLPAPQPHLARQVQGAPHPHRLAEGETLGSGQDAATHDPRQV